MARDDGVKVGAGGAIIKEIVEVPTTSVPLAKKENKKVEVLKEVIEDTLPSDVEPEVENDEDI